MGVMTFHYDNPPAGLYLCHRVSTIWDTDLAPCEEAIKVMQEDGNVRREHEWAVMIHDLATLETFIEKYGDCIINRKGVPSITIYDDYVE